MEYLIKSILAITFFSLAISVLIAAYVTRKKK